jgi:hypothetical protein
VSAYIKGAALGLTAVVVLAAVSFVLTAPTRTQSKQEVQTLEPIGPALKLKDKYVTEAQIIRDTRTGREYLVVWNTHHVSVTLILIDEAPEAKKLGASTVY